jgi:hypothetical protein
MPEGDPISPRNLRVLRGSALNGSVNRYQLPESCSLRRRGGPADYVLRRLFPPLSHDLPVHRIGRQVDLPRPCDRAVIDEHSLEKTDLAQRREYSSQFVNTEADTSA